MFIYVTFVIFLGVHFLTSPFPDCYVIPLYLAETPLNCHFNASLLFLSLII
ncbi:hypothetical protein Lalb_Chr21g0315531 [Lupinus albus]|uniref:Uncharacterized protein n=1 Tax=Lupinus albus TaxID=3870 RepID=A0A6A4NTX1_LUPAL|nr:hypothetical protein Lalb_Chr21g0315531 [Lupinus albus]